jgi:hypothetical protein
VRKSAEHLSTMGSYSLGNGLRGRLAWSLTQRKIPVLHSLLLYRRQRIFRKWSRSEIVDAPFVEKPSRLEWS